MRTLVLGGGFAGSYAGTAARQARLDDPLGGELHAVHAAPRRGRVGHARATARRRPAEADVPQRRSPPRSRDGPRRGAAHRPRRHPRGRARDPLRPARARPRLDHPRLPVPGLHEHGVGFKDLADAIALRNRVLQQLERAAIRADRPEELGFVFVGAGYAGVEALGELNDLARAALRFYRTSEACPSAGCSWTPRRRSSPRSRDGSANTRRVTSRSAGSRSTSGRRSPPTTGTRLCSRTASPSRHGRSCGRWSRANPLLGELGLPLDARGRVRVDAFLHVEAARTCGHSGTAPRCPTHGRRGVDPPTSQHALRQARRLTKNLTRESPEPYGTACSARWRRRPLQGDRRDPGNPLARLPRLVRRPDIPPVPARSSHGTPRRPRLDRGAPLPPGCCRALDARSPAWARGAAGRLAHRLQGPSTATDRPRARARRDRRHAQLDRGRRPS